MTASVGHVVVFVQENHTTDNYFRSMSAWGANVAADWPVQPNPPAKDQPHNRAAYAKWLHAQQAGTTSPATHTQFDTVAVLPYYAYLAATGAFLENHCSGFGTNSTPNHLLIVGGQSPTLRNPPRAQAPPVWDMPSVLGGRPQADVEGLHRQFLLPGGLLPAVGRLSEHRPQRPDRHRRGPASGVEHGVARQPV